MKLSEAIRKGRQMGVVPMTGKYLAMARVEDGKVIVCDSGDVLCGCAMGMALVAKIGVEAAKKIAKEPHLDIEGMCLEEFPVLKQKARGEYDGKDGFLRPGGMGILAERLIEMFDEFFWTEEQIAKAVEESGLE